MLNVHHWYSQLIKPSIKQPEHIYKPVWNILYILIVICYAYVAYLFFTGQIPFIVLLPFIISMIFNFASSPLHQFNLKHSVMVAVDLLLIIAIFMWTMIWFFPSVHWTLYINVQYLLWVAFAAALHFSVSWLNR